MKPIECSTMLRAYMMLSAALYAVTAITQPETLLFKIANHDATALGAMYLMGLFAVLGMIDLVVNDLMPERFVIRRALQDRHLVNMGLSLCFAVQMFTTVRYELPLSAMPYYALYAVFIPLSAFADVQRRFKNKKGCS